MYKQQNEQQNGEKRPRFSTFYDPTPENIHCRHCKTLMQNGVCPTCGFRMYVPMDEKKKNKIKFILTCVFMALAVALFVVFQITKSS